MNTTGMLIETLLYTLGDTKTKTEVLTNVLLRAGVPLPKESSEEGPKDDGESETVTGGEPETIKKIIKDPYEQSAEHTQPPVRLKTPFG